MIIVTGEFRLPPENMERVRPHMRALLEATRKEDGCLLYAFGEDVLDPGLIRVVERWRDWAAFAAHGPTPHIAAWGAALKQLGGYGRDLHAHEGMNGREI